MRQNKKKENIRETKKESTRMNPMNIKKKHFFIYKKKRTRLETTIDFETKRSFSDVSPIGSYFQRNNYSAIDFTHLL